MDLTNFYVIGLSYKEAQLSIREQFSLSNKSSIDLLNNAYSIGINELIINNTCNRIELYGFANNSKVLIELVCKYSGGKISNFEKYCYTLLNEDAINHIFRVGLGLESQILGDFEIIGQLKQSFYRSKNLRMAHGFSERLINSTIQASKRVKTETGISTGAADLILQESINQTNGKISSSSGIISFNKGPNSSTFVCKNSIFFNCSLLKLFKFFFNSCM